MADKAKFEGFIDANLTKEDKHAIKANLPDAEAIVAQLSRWTDKGYKFSISFDRNNDCHTASLYGQWKNSNHAGYCLTCRHTDVHVAIAGLIHIASFIFAGDWPTADNTDW